MPSDHRARRSGARRFEPERQERKHHPLSGLFVRNDTRSRPFQAKNRIMDNGVTKFPIEGIFLALRRRPLTDPGPRMPIRLSHGRPQATGSRRRNVSAKGTRPGGQQSMMGKTIEIRPILSQIRVDNAIHIIKYASSVQRLHDRPHGLETGTCAQKSNAPARPR